MGHHRKTFRNLSDVIDFAMTSPLEIELGIRNDDFAIFGSYNPKNGRWSPSREELISTAIRQKNTRYTVTWWTDDPPRENLPKLTRVYAICYPTSSDVRYIGITTRTLSTRLNQHIGDARDEARLDQERQTDPQIYNRFQYNRFLLWLHSLGNIRPEIAELESIVTDREGALFREKQWVWHFFLQGASLLNSAHIRGKNNHITLSALKNIADDVRNKDVFIALTRSLEIVITRHGTPSILEWYLQQLNIRKGIVSAREYRKTAKLYNQEIVRRTLQGIQLGEELLSILSSGLLSQESCTRISDLYHDRNMFCTLKPDYVDTAGNT